MKNGLKCPKCGSKKLTKTGLSHGVGTGPVFPKPISKQYQCSECEHYFNFPKLSKDEEVNN